uniref:Putative de novo glutathione biosynthesis protein n=1 Tax=viral metagenome TaxID=1070528 RepID=A0A6H1ZWL5_9ZZZZ
MRRTGGQNGIELEAFVQDRSLIDNDHLGFKHKSASFAFKSISANFYLDDGKPEYPSNPHSSLEELIEEIKSVLAQVQDICEREGWLFSSIGCHPFASSFASYHIHTSLSEVPLVKDIAQTRKYLLDLQPYIALLSQNSPAICGTKAPYKDVRLTYSRWARFTNSERSSHDDHYLSLAEGRTGHTNVNTLECRLPSSCSLHQGEAVLVFIKAMVELANLPILPIAKNETMFYRVLKWGGQALIPVMDYSTMNFLGSGKEVLVPISELFRLFLTDNTIQPVFREIIQELPSKDRDDVMEYFKIIASGLTPSDYIIKLCEDLNWDNKAISEAISRITMEGYLNSKPFWELIPTPSKPELPMIKDIYSLEEALELIKEKGTSVKFESTEDLDYILHTSKYSLRNCAGTRIILRNLAKKPEMQSISSFLNNRKLMSSEATRILNFLARKKVLETNSPTEWTSELQYGPGKKFPYVIQLAREENLL